ncbi:MAG: hypothetical protein HY777_08305 [Betaproteobacteria bacterium]|nr:hypothetical protein [Betaproteobacteria bacterium]
MRVTKSNTTQISVSIARRINMELRDYIEDGQQKAGSIKELANILGIAANSLTDAKHSRRGLPLVSCYKLAELIEARPEAIAAASAIVTEKDEGALAYLHHFVQAGRLIYLKPDEPEPSRGYDVILANERGDNHVGRRS